MTQASEKLSLRVTQASLNQTSLDWAQNMPNHYAAIDEAVAQGSDMVFMPELSVTSYEVNDNYQGTDNLRIYESLSDIAVYANRLDPNLVVSVGHPWRVQLRDAFDKADAHPDIIKNAFYDRLNLPFNVQTLIGGGDILGMTAKANLFNDERGYEKRYFNEYSFRDAKEAVALLGFEDKYGTLPIILPDGKKTPFGRPIIYIHDKDGNGYFHVTFICEEKWVATKFDGQPFDDSRYEQLNVIPSALRYLGTKEGLLAEISNASPPSKLKQDKHMHLNNLASQYADVVIDTDGLGSSGATFAQFGHRLISQNGETISAGQRINFSQIATTTSTVEITNADAALQDKAHHGFMRDFKDTSAAPKSSLIWNVKNSGGEWDNPENEHRWKEERIRSNAQWMFDYMKKTGARGIMEAISGGKDSTFNCAMVRVMVELAVDDLGVEGFCEQMSHLPYNDEIIEAFRSGGKDSAIETCMDHMLTGVYMGTNNSSFETWYAAQSSMEGGTLEDGTEFSGFGGKFVERNVQDLLDFYGYMFAVTGFDGPQSIRHSEIEKELRKVKIIEKYGLKGSQSVLSKAEESEIRERAQKLYKLEINEEVGEFLNASPHDNTPEQMDVWEKELFEKYPEIDRLVSAAKPNHGLAYENIQARGREVLIMLFANVEGKMAVANPNLDEAYGAYATFGGDLHSGTVNWNAGLHKSDQEALMEYLEEYGLPGVMPPMTSLRAANNNRPSAELQPKEGDEVTQFDEEALQGTFPQKAALARLKHHTKVEGDNGYRWMNAGELFDKVRDDKLFNQLDDNNLFNAVAHFYQRWEGPAQHKIHATPIAPTFGENVDKQSSLRTPNLGGGCKDELVQLGLNIIFEWAEEDGFSISESEKYILGRRAWQDKEFMNKFYSGAKNTDDSIPNMSFNLRALYSDIKEQGWDEVLSPLAPQHPVGVVNQARLAVA